MRQTMFFVVFCVSATVAFSQEEPAKPTEDVPFLIRSLRHSDVQIRQTAAERLRDDAQDATAPLVATILNPSSDRLHAARAAAILIERIELLRGDKLAQQLPRLKLTEDDRRDLQPLVSFIGKSDGEDWRWYLAVTVLDEVQPTLLSGQMPALVDGLTSSSSMRRYASLRAVFHLRNSASAAKGTLLDLLARAPAPLYGIYLRYDLPIIENAVAYTADVRVYFDDEVGEFHYGKLQRYYGHAHLLICDTLLATGAGFSDVGTHLVRLANSRNQSVKFHAVRQLLRLGAKGQAAAAATLNELLTSSDDRWIEQVAEEHSRWVAERENSKEATVPEGFQCFLTLGGAKKDVVSSVAGLLSNQDARVRHCAAEVLGSIGGTHEEIALPALEKAIASERVLGGPTLAAMILATAKIKLRKTLKP